MLHARIVRPSSNTRKAKSERSTVRTTAAARTDASGLSARDAATTWFCGHGERNHAPRCHASSLVRPKTSAFSLRASTIWAAKKWPWLGSTALTAGGITHRKAVSLSGPQRTGNPFLRACEALPFRSDSRGCSATRESIFLTSPHQNRRACYNPGCYLLEESSWLNSIPKASYFG